MGPGQARKLAFRDDKCRGGGKKLRLAWLSGYFRIFPIK
jgi:hypothetical protein